MTGSLAVVGLGPGGPDTLTPEAASALAAADALYGYGPYLDRVPQRPHDGLLPDNLREVERPICPVEGGHEPDTSSWVIRHISAEALPQSGSCFLDDTRWARATSGGVRGLLPSSRPVALGGESAVP